MRPGLVFIVIGLYYGIGPAILSGFRLFRPGNVLLGLDLEVILFDNKTMQSYQAPAKINLSLKVLGKREDGYHEIDTLMAPLTLHDELHFTESDHTRLVCDDPEIPLDESNLIMKAVRVFEQYVGRRVHYEIDLIKRIPHGAGLGGGSSDAATTLIALNEMEGTDLTTDELIRLASGLGSDVGFFINGFICRCQGRGEIVSHVPSMDDFRVPILLLKPGFSVPTPDAYKRWAGARPLPGIPYGPQRFKRMELFNDLEMPVFEKYMFLAEIKKWLLSRSGVYAAMMSGSGSTIYAMITNEKRGLKIAREIRRQLDPTMWSWVGLCGV